MPRPKNADAERTRERILDSALEAFAEHGIDGVSIREIGRRAGVTLSTVHHYFGTKEQLYGACIDLMYERLAGLREELAEVALDQTAPPKERLATMTRRAFRFARSHRSAIRLLLRSVVAAGQLDEDRRREVQEPALQAAAAVLGPIAGRPAAEMRIAVQNCTVLIARNAISGADEIRLVTGVDDTEQGLQRLEDELARTVVATIFPSPDDAP